MSRGINRAHYSEMQSLYESKKLSEHCIFISHKYEDLDAAREISEYIKDSDIDVYLDDNDDGLQEAVKNNDSEGIVRCIEKALQNSTHILILVTENTRESWWVPYETGYAKCKKKSIASLLLKHVNEFPDYLKIERTLEGYCDLSKYIKSIKNQYQILFESLLESVPDIVHKGSLLKYINE